MAIWGREGGHLSKGRQLVTKCTKANDVPLCDPCNYHCDVKGQHWKQSRWNVKKCMVFHVVGSLMLLLYNCFYLSHFVGKRIPLLCHPHGNDLSLQHHHRQPADSNLKACGSRERGVHRRGPAKHTEHCGGAKPDPIPSSRSQSSQYVWSLHWSLFCAFEASLHSIIALWQYVNSFSLGSLSRELLNHWHKQFSQEVIQCIVHLQWNVSRNKFH